MLGSLMFVPFMLWEITTLDRVMTINIQSMTGILYGIFFSSAAAWFLEAFAVKRMPANEVGIFTYIDPIVAVMVAIPLLGETVTFTYLLGAIFVFGGIFIAEGRLHWHPLHKLHD
jgi:drug/metabolite transporter (DMT)-like permease